jgi:acyl-coenzyme A thioesterase PaaI-like protein
VRDVRFGSAGLEAVEACRILDQNPVPHALATEIETCARCGVRTRSARDQRLDRPRVRAQQLGNVAHGEAAGGQLANAAALGLIPSLPERRRGQRGLYWRATARRLRYARRDRSFVRPFRRSGLGRARLRLAGSTDRRDRRGEAAQLPESVVPLLNAAKLLDLWRRLAPLPWGPWLFSKLFGFAVPYSGSVGPRIRVLEPGYAEVEIPDRRSNRNHLGSVHAIALMNLAELTSGLAMMAGLPPTVRGIVTTLSMTYHRKARGTIRGVARVVVPTVTEDRDFDVMAECFDREGTLVATGNVRWRLGPVRPKAG